MHTIKFPGLRKYTLYKHGTSIFWQLNKCRQMCTFVFLGKSFLFGFLFWVNEANSSTHVLLEDTLYRSSLGLFTDGDGNVLSILNFPWSN